MSAVPTITLELDGGNIYDSSGNSIQTPYQISIIDGYLTVNNTIAGNNWIGDNDNGYQVNNVTKIGYYLDGWYNYSNSSEMVFDPGGNFSSYTYSSSFLPEYVINTNSGYGWNTSFSGTLTLKAHWMPCEVVIVLHPNGGTFVNTTTQSNVQDGILNLGYAARTGITYIYSSSYDINITHSDGREFYGWSLTQDGSQIIAKDGTYYESNSTYILPLHSVTISGQNFSINSGVWTINRDLETGLNLYAIWEQQQPPSSGSSAAILSSTSKYRDTSVLVEYCQVFFEANGAEGTMEQQQFTVGEPRELKLNEFTYPEHTFIGWALEPQGEVVYTDGQEITISKDTTLYAKWIIPLPDIPDVDGESDDNGVPTWVFILIGVIIAAIIIILLLYFFVFKRT